LELNDVTQLISSLWYVVAFIEKNLSISAMVDADRYGSLLENCPKPFLDPVAVVVPCLQILTDEGECHVRERTAAVPALLSLSSRVRETFALHLCDTGTCIRNEAGRGFIPLPLLDKSSSFIVFDKLQGYPPRIA
jgi:hypothetical protein